MNELREKLILAILDLNAGGSATDVASAIEALIDAKIAEALRQQALERLQR